MSIIYKKYFSIPIPELDELNKWSVFIKFNLSDKVHLFYIKEKNAIVAYALVTEHIQVPILNGRAKLPNLHYLLDYIEVKQEYKSKKLAQTLLQEIFNRIKEPIVLETLEDTTEYFLKLGAIYIREPVANGINIMLFNPTAIKLDYLDKKTQQCYNKYCKLE